MARAGRPRNDPSANTSTRRALLDATIDSLVEIGFSATSARAVATRAKVAPGGVFYHFGTMDELLGTVYDELQRARMERLAAAFRQPAGDLPAAIAAAARAEFERPDSRALLEIVVGAISSEPLAARVHSGIDESLRFTSDVLQTVLADVPGASAMPLPVELVAELAASAFFGLDVLHQVGRRPDLDRLAGVVRLLTAMLGSLPPRGPAPGVAGGVAESGAQAGDGG